MKSAEKVHEELS